MVNLGGVKLLRAGSSKHKEIHHAGEEIHRAGEEIHHAGEEIHRAGESPSWRYPGMSHTSVRLYL